MSESIVESYDVLILGSGPGGYSAAFRSADLGLKTLLVEREAALGGVCLNVGCIPSKALLHVAATIESARGLADHGVDFPEPTLDLGRLRQWKDQVVGRLTTGLGQMAKGRRVTVLRGEGRFVDPHHLNISQTDGQVIVVRFARAIIAVGSSPVSLPFLPADPRILDSTGALALNDIPGRFLVVGGGIIGLEMATVYAALGSRIDVVEMSPGLMPGTDRDLVKVWEKYNRRRFASLRTGIRVSAVEARSEGLRVTFEGGAAGSESAEYDRILVAVGRRPNGLSCGAELAGVVVDEAGFIPVDSQQRTNVPHIYAIGDVVGQPMLAHKAVHEGHVAAEAAHGQRSVFEPRQIPSVAYTDPEIAWAGLTETQAKAQGLAYGKAVFPWAASGRALAQGREEGMTKLLFDEQTHRVLGGGIVGAHAGDLIGEVALAIEMGCDATDLGKTIHPHPTLGETIGLAAELYEGVCTDLPPLRR